MPSSTMKHQKLPYSRIYWTRARTKAAQATENQPPLEGLQAPITDLSSPKPLSPAVVATEDPVARLHMQKLRAEIAFEIGEALATVNEEWAQSLYADVVDESVLDSYLATAASGYQLHEKRWKQLPRGPTNVEELYGPVSRVVSHIISELGEVCGEGVTREVVNSHTSTYRQPKYKDICPDVSIKANGPSFKRGRSDYLEGVGYSNVASLIDVHLHERSDIDQAVQAGFYCRQIYMNQPNRNFVRTLVMTESSVRMVHYDRSGFYLTPLIDIHRDPRTFIRLVLGLSSPNEATLGFDTSIQWTINPETGAKMAGTIKATDPTGEAIVYNINMDRVPFFRGHILGRGTTCWYATQPTTGSEVVIKDTWRTESKLPESEFLRAAQGVDGVVQMISFQDHRAETAAYRPAGFSFGDFENRIKSRTIMLHYGKSIEHFTSRYQAISALRDALAGHRNLRAKGILHRDVSMQNVLLGSLNAPPGLRGILIDLDMASWTWALDALRAESGLGTKRFQSVAVLRNLKLVLPPQHDHLDDLESFFHILCHLLLLYKSPGNRSKELESALGECETIEDPLRAGLAKASFLTQPWCVEPWWGEACEDLFTEFQTILNTIAGRKNWFQGRNRMNPEEKRDASEALAKEKEDIYDEIIELFDTALAAIEKEDNTPPSVPTTTSACAPAPSAHAETITSLKRRSAAEHPDAPSPKRPALPLPTEPPVTLETRPRESCSVSAAARHPNPAIFATPTAPIVTTAPTPAIAPSETGHVGTSLKRRLEDANTDAPPPSKRSRTSKPTAPPKPRKRARQARADTLPAQPVRRSARLNRC